MVRTKVTPRKGEKGVTWVLRTRVAVYMGEKEKRPSSSIHLPSTAQEAPPEAGEIMGRIAEAEQLEGVERSPLSLPTWQLSQMAVEARPSKSGGEEPACKKICPTVGGKAPQKEFLQAGKVKKTRKY